MTQPVYEEIITATEHLVVGDKISIGGIIAPIEKIQTNSRDEVVLHLFNPNAIHKSRSKMMLIIPKKIAVEKILLK